MQRLGLRRLAWRLLSPEHAEIRIPEALLRRLRLRRGRLFFLPNPRAGCDEGVAPDDSAWLPVHDEDGETDPPREEAERRRREPRMALCVCEGAEGEVRPLGRPAPAFDQVRFPLGPDAGLREGLRDDVPARDRVPAQILVPGGRVFAPSGPERRDGLDGEPVPRAPPT